MTGHDTTLLFQIDGPGSTPDEPAFRSVAQPPGPASQLYRASRALRDEAGNGCARRPQGIAWK